MKLVQIGNVRVTAGPESPDGVEVNVIFSGELWITSDMLTKKLLVLAPKQGMLDTMPCLSGEIERALIACGEISPRASLKIPFEEKSPFPNFIIQQVWWAIDSCRYKDGRPQIEAVHFVMKAEVADGFLLALKATHTEETARKTSH